MSDNNVHDGGSVHPLLTDDELDSALATLHADHVVRRPDLRGARAALVAAATDETVPPIETTEVSADVARRRRYVQWSGAAAAVVALVAAGLVAQHLKGGPVVTGTTMTPAQAALASIQERDLVVRPGQYLYVATTAWVVYHDSKNDKPFMYGSPLLDETWVPADRRQVWETRTGPDGPYYWLSGNPHDATEYNVTLSVPGTKTVTAPCGDFAVVQPSGATAGCARREANADWASPTAAWLAALPTDPRQMLLRLQQVTIGDKVISHANEELALTNAEQALATGLVPGRVRAVIYQALALLPDLKVNTRQANGNGVTGIGIGLDASQDQPRQSMIIDRDTGRMIGMLTAYPPTAADTDEAGLNSTPSSLLMGVVDRIGAKPTS
jgi:hypothetical protein